MRELDHRPETQKHLRQFCYNVLPNHAQNQNTRQNKQSESLRNG
jgi:hypothetical protein